MSLSEIKNKLYKKEEEKNLSWHDSSEYDINVAKRNTDEKPNSFDEWEEKQKGLAPEGKKAMRLGMIVLGIIIGLAVLIGGLYQIKRSFFLEEKTLLSIDGPEEVKSGMLLTYEIGYTNNNRVDLKDATIRLTFPEEFRPEENFNFKMEGTTTGVYTLGIIPSQSSGKVIFNARTYTPRGANIYLKADLSYSPANFNFTYVKNDQLPINVVSSPITLNIMAPQNVSSGNEVNYVINYRNAGKEEIRNVRIRAEYPDKFTFSQSEPKAFEGNNIWYVGNLPAESEGKIVVNGKLEGLQDNVKIFKVAVGVVNQEKFVSYNEDEVKTKIVTAPFVISQTVNGLTSLNANPGETLKFEIDYKNESKIGLREAIVTEYLDSPVLDYTTLDILGGAYDSENKTIIWKASDYPELKSLEAGEGGKIKFSINVKDVISINSANDKNFVISSRAKIDSPDVPTPINMNKIIAGNVMDIKLNSKLILDTKGFYDDSVIPNSGPIPPKVSEETTYTIHWVAKNVSNDITEAKVEAVLPTIATLTGKILPEGAPLTYNERTNSMVWDIGKMESGSGVLNQPKEVIFQVRIKPSIDLLNKEVELLGKSIFSAKDTFTGEAILTKSEEKTTRLLEDNSLLDKSRVVN